MLKSFPPPHTGLHADAVPARESKWRHHIINSQLAHGFDDVGNQQQKKELFADILELGDKLHTQPMSERCVRA